jgi:WD40 repeat protein
MQITKTSYLKPILNVHLIEADRETQLKILSRLRLSATMNKYVEAYIAKHNCEVIGGALSTIMERQRKIDPTKEIPFLVYRIVNRIMDRGLGTPNIFTFDPKIHSTQLLRDQFNSGKDLTAFGQYLPDAPYTEMLELLCEFIDQLATPIVPDTIAKLFLGSVEQTGTVVEKKQMFRELILQLPKDNQSCFQAILFLCYYLNCNSPMNGSSITQSLMKLLIPCMLNRDLRKSENITAIQRAITVGIQLTEMFHEIFPLRYSYCTNRFVSLHHKYMFHSKPVQAICGKFEREVWTCDSSGTIQVWCKNSGSYLRTICWSTPLVVEIDFIQNHVWLVGQRLIGIFSVFDNAVIKTFPRDGFCICEGLNDTVWIGEINSITVLHATTFEELRQIHLDNFTDKQAIPVCKSMLLVHQKMWCGFSDGEIHCYSAEDFKEEFSFVAHTHPINKLLLLNDFVWSCADDQEICVWTLDGKLFKRLQHSSKVVSLAGLGNSHVWSSSWDRSVRIWDAQSFQLGLYYEYRVFGRCSSRTSSLGD